MQTKEPCEALKDVVHSYIQIKAEGQTLYPVMPDGPQAVYISPHGTMIGGALTASRDIPLSQAGEYFGIWFNPGALRHLFSLDLSEISGQFVDEKYFLCRRFQRLHSEIYQHNDFYDRARVCENWVLEKFSRKRTTGFDHALSLIYQSSGSERVVSIANKVGWSSRHLNRQFLEHTGLGTKTFSQVIRAQTLCKQLYLKPANSINMSMDLAYYDQPHLIKAFKKYFKLTPGQFINQYMSDFYNR